MQVDARFWYFENNQTISYGFVFLKLCIRYRKLKLKIGEETGININLKKPTNQL